MIIKLFKNTGEAKGAINYLLKEDAEILKGDADQTNQICKDFCKDFKCKTTFGVISFRKDEKLTEEQEKKLIADFEKTFLGNMRNRVNVLWVKHNDTENDHYHFLINRVDLESGKSFNPFPPSKLINDLKDRFREIKNHELGFKEVKPKILKMHLSDDERKALKQEINGFKNLNDKVKIDKALQDLVKGGEIKNRKELIEFLKESGKVLSRVGDDYISIENKEGRNIRLKGGIYTRNDDKDYSLLVAENKKEKPVDINKSITDLNRLVKLRDDFNEKRYSAKPHKPLFSKPQQTDQKGQEVNKPAQANPPPQKTVQEAKKPVAELPNTQDQKQTRDQGEFKPSASASVTSGGDGSALSAVGVAQAGVDKAMAILASARTPAEKAQAEQQLIVAKMALQRAIANHEEEKKRNLNKVKI